MPPTPKRGGGRTRRGRGANDLREAKSPRKKGKGGETPQEKRTKGGENPPREKNRITKDPESIGKSNGNQTRTEVV